MAENRYVFNGAVAGFISGVAVAVYIYLTMPPLNSLIRSVEKLTGYSISGSAGTILGIILLLAPVLLTVLSVIIGTITGSLQGYFNKLFRSEFFSALLSGLVFQSITAGPDLVLGSSGDRLLRDLSWGLLYILVLVLLALIKPRHGIAGISDEGGEY